MSAEKKKIRLAFRDSVFFRDGNKCRVCGVKGNLDAHHVTDRNLMPNGGYVSANGISLCEDCHFKAEAFHRGESVPAGFMPDDLYKLIGSSIEKARAASEKL